MGLPIPLAGEMLVPAPPHGHWVQEAARAQPVFVQERFGPFAQRATQPGAQGHGEARFRALGQMR